MAKLSDFRMNSRAIEDGEFVKLDDEWGGISIRTRGYTDEHTDKQAARLRVAAKEAGVAVDRLPTKDRQRIYVEGLIEDLLLDVSGLTEEDGTTPISFEKFCDILRDKDYRSLVLACYAAVGKVGQRRVADQKDAVGN